MVQFLFERVENMMEKGEFVMAVMLFTEFVMAVMLQFLCKRVENIFPTMFSEAFLFRAFL